MSAVAARKAAFVAGASSGIGLAFARALSERQDVALVIASCRGGADSPRASSLASLGPKIRIVSADATQPDSVDAAAARAQSELQAAGLEALDVLVTCPGVLRVPQLKLPETTLRNVTYESMLLNLQVNTMMPMLFMKHLVPLMYKSQRAVVAAVSARVASQAENQMGGWYSYRASKAALNVLVRNVAIECRNNRKSVLAVAFHPGSVDTELGKPYHANMPKDKLLTPDHSVQRMLAKMDSLAAADSGGFFNFDGSPIPF
jgi:NAD(P)-dependent dehydrogenase (short-subunit alcohol dehydrogenase family)